MNSYSECLYPVIGCLKAFDTFKSTKEEWITFNDKQKKVLSLYENYKSLGVLDTSELISIVSEDVKVVNKFLKNNGFDIQLNETKSGLPSVSVASILKLIMRWKLAGRNRVIYSDGKEYKGFDLYKSIFVHNENIIKIETDSDDIICIEVDDKIPFGCDYIVIPEIDYDDQPDITYMCGISKGIWFIEQAIQQTKFKMNKKGALLESAAAMTVISGSSLDSEFPTYYWVNKPFKLWIERKGTGIIFDAYFDRDSWIEDSEKMKQEEKVQK